MNVDMHVGFLLAQSAFGGPPPTPPIGPATGTNALVDLTKSIAALTALALMLGLIAGTAVYVLEGILLRKYLNIFLVRSWVKRRYADVSGAGGSAAEDLLHRLLPRWYTLPAKQFAGAIAAAFQSSKPGPLAATDPKEPSQDDVRSHFAKIGRSLLEAGPEPTIKDASDFESWETRRISESLYYAERALDDLQAQLAARWMLSRFGLGAIVVVVLSGLVAAVDIPKLGFFAALVAYPMIWIVAALFAPVFRDLVELVSNRRA